MKNFITFLMFFYSAGAVAKHTHRILQAGECVTVSHRTICAQSYQERELTTVANINAICNLEKHGDGPNKWVMYQVTTNSKGEVRKTFLQTYPHFEGALCEDRATKIGG